MTVAVKLRDGTLSQGIVDNVGSVMAMMEAMQGGRGSVSTVHAHSALDTIERLVTLITRARGNVDTSFGYRLVAQNVDLVVHVGLVDESHLEGGRKWRHVDEVVSLVVAGSLDSVVDDDAALVESPSPERVTSTTTRPRTTSAIRATSASPMVRPFDPEPRGGSPPAGAS